MADGVGDGPVSFLSLLGCPRWETGDGFLFVTQQHLQTGYEKLFRLDLWTPLNQVCLNKIPFSSFCFLDLTTHN